MPVLQQSGLTTQRSYSKAVMKKSEILLAFFHTFLHMSIFFCTFAAKIWINGLIMANPYVELARKEAQYEAFVAAGDYQQALPLLEVLAEESNERYKYKLELATWYEEGKGCEPNPQRAFELVEYIYKNGSMSIYNHVYEDATDKLIRYLNTGYGCEKDEDRAFRVAMSLSAKEQRMNDLLDR